LSAGVLASLGAGLSVGVPTVASLLLIALGFGLGVACAAGFSVAGVASCFGLRRASALPAQPSSPPCVADRDDLQDRVLLAVALLAAIVVAAALLEHRDLFALGLGDDLGRDGQSVGP
jgi:hypothetical protein